MTVHHDSDPTPPHGILRPVTPEQDAAVAEFAFTLRLLAHPMTGVQTITHEERKALLGAARLLEELRGMS